MKVYVSIIFCFLLLSCKDDAKKFEGKWEKKSNQENITIYRSGTNFIFGDSYGKWPAKYDNKNEKMVVTYSDGIKQIHQDIFYNAKDNSLIRGGEEYIKVSE